MTGAPIPIFDTDDYIVEHRRDYTPARDEMKGTELIPFLEKLYNDRETHDITLYHVLSEAAGMDDKDTRYCITFTYDGSNGKHVNIQIMAADFVDVFMQRWANDPKASGVRLRKIEQIGQFNNNWFFRDFASRMMEQIKTRERTS